VSHESIVTTIDLLRHGQCVDGHCYRGTTDVELSAEGIATMQQRVNNFIQAREPLWQTIITSPLIRCAIFANDLAEQYQKPLQAEKALQEMHFGDWDGESIDHIWQTQQRHVEQWYSNPIQYPPPNGEAADVFAARVQTCFSLLIQQHQGQHILLVTHGGVMRVLLAHCLSMSLLDLHRFDVPYACLSRIQVITSTNNDEKYYRLIAHNMTSEINEK
jgi:broad specificity phosphatase PhoE